MRDEYDFSEGKRGAIIPGHVTNRFFPFHVLGFQCNPFRALTDEEWVEAAVIPAEIQSALDRGYANLQVLGREGQGKTTLLLYLTAEKKHSGQRAAYEYLPEGSDRFQTRLENLDCFVLDEGQRLSKRERKRLMEESAAVRLVVGSHEDLVPLFRAYERPLTTLELDAFGPDHLKVVLNRRLDYFSLETADPPHFSDEAVSFLWGKFGRNIRASEHYLYEYFQYLIGD